MTQPTSQTFKQLTDAETADDILAATARCIWEAEKKEGKPPSPSLKEIQDFTLPIPDEDRVFSTEKENFQYAFFFHTIGTTFLSTAAAPPRNLLESLHQTWLRAREAEPTLKHPITPIVRAWIQEQTAKHITTDLDQKRSAAVLKHPLGSIRETTFCDVGDSRLREFATPERFEHTKALQLPFDLARETPSFLPPLMPLEVAHPLGVTPQTKSGAVSHTLRIFFEALMALDPSETQADLLFTLGDLID